MFNLGTACHCAALYVVLCSATLLTTQQAFSVCISPTAVFKIIVMVGLGGIAIGALAEAWWNVLSTHMMGPVPFHHA